jgi:hypothetical protein
MISKSNLNKTDNKKWKQVADICLYSLPFLSTAVLTMPISDTGQKWLIFGINFLVVIFKAISKFTSNEEIINNDSDNTDKL